MEAALRGGDKNPFIFDMLGQLTAIGNRDGVADILGLNFSVIPAWILWRTLHLMKPPRLETRDRMP